MGESAINESGIEGLRRVPRQDRSRARVEAIWAAADALLCEGGVDAVSMRAVAARAAVPVGTVYQFFTDKDALLASVARRHVDAFAAALESLLERAATAPWSELVTLLFDQYVEVYRRNPALRTIRRERRLPAELTRLDEANTEAVADRVRRILVEQAGLTDGPELATASRVGVHTAEALLHLAFRNDPSGDPAVLAEAHRLLQLYLADLTVDARHRSSATGPGPASG